jgi:hypothetical protein
MNKINRIQRILSSVELTTCTNKDCNLSYVPLNEHFEHICPICNTKFFDEFIPSDEFEYEDLDEARRLVNL